MSITAEEIMVELERIESENPDGFTTHEIANCMSVSIYTARNRLKKLIASGSAKHVGQRVVVDISGKHQRVPIYLLTKE